MKILCRALRILPLLATALLATAAESDPSDPVSDPQAPEPAEPPLSWIDPATGYRVHRLSTEPNSASLYFNQNGYTPDGKRMIYTTPGGISVLDLVTRKSRSLVQGDVRVIEAGRKTPVVFYIKRQERAIYSTNLDTGETRKLADLPRRGRVSTINADETLAAGTYIVGDGNDYNQRPAPTSARPNNETGAQQGHPLDQPPNKGRMMEERLAARLPIVMFTIDLRTGETKEILKSTDWLNHLLFSPVDPTLLMYCHEGPWQKVDRIWTIRTDGSRNTLVHKRMMAMEIAGHEFWSRDGKTIWYDLQIPKGESFYVAGYNVETSERVWYHLERKEWSIHFNVSDDGTLFCGDGGDERQVSRETDGRWINLFRPALVGSRELYSKDLVTPGVFHSERLVDMSRHDYKLEPNVSFTPDKSMVIFRSNMFGPTYVFGVDLKKETAVLPE